MSYRFTIQASSPRFTNEFDPEDESVSDAIQTAFPLETESAILSWNWVYVPLSYKYDLSMMVECVVELVGELDANVAGRKTIQWPSNTFASTWQLEWSDGVVTIHSEWLSVVGGSESALTAVSAVVMDCSAFLAEWKRPLEVVVAALVSAGYTSELRGMDQLVATTRKIRRYGVLYQT